MCDIKVLFDSVRKYPVRSLDSGLMNGVPSILHVVLLWVRIPENAAAVGARLCRLALYVQHIQSHCWILMMLMLCYSCLTLLPFAAWNGGT